MHSILFSFLLPIGRFDPAVNAWLAESPSFSSVPNPPARKLCDRRSVLERALSDALLTTAMVSAAMIATPLPAAAVSPVPDTTAVPLLSAPSTPPIGTRDPHGMLSLESAARLDADALRAGLLRYPHPGLRRTASPVQSFDGDLEAVADLLVRTMETPATTAVQYGIDARILVLKGVQQPGRPGNVVVFVNPNVLSRSSEDKMVQWREYCLVVGTTSTASSTTAAASDEALPPDPDTLQRLEVDLLRDEFVEVAAQDLTGRPIRMTLRGEASRAFQHELDHLDGILIVDHAGLDELPEDVAKREAPFHAQRQRRAFARPTYQGNGPLYW